MSKQETEPKRTRHSWGLFQHDDPFDRMRDELDHLFSQYLQPRHLPFFGDNREQKALPMATNLDVVSTETGIRLVLDVPGVVENELDLSVDDGSITISGNRKSETSDEGDNFIRVERSLGQFRRTIPLPFEIDVDRIEAVLKDGVLRVDLPKSPAAQEKSKKIAVNKG